MAHLQVAGRRIQVIIGNRLSSATFFFHEGVDVELEDEGDSDILPRLGSFFSAILVFQDGVASCK